MSSTLPTGSTGQAHQPLFGIGLCSRKGCARAVEHDSAVYLRSVVQAQISAKAGNHIGDCLCQEKCAELQPQIQNARESKKERDEERE